MLPTSTFKTVVKSTPLISIDLIVKDKKNNILLGKRKNRPAKEQWFVPGGRIMKDETFETAFQRLITEELNLLCVDSSFKGVYQHFYNDNFSLEHFSTHYVVLAYEIHSHSGLLKLPTDQHSKYKWFSEAELLLDAQVHEHTKWYFQDEKCADSKIK